MSSLWRGWQIYFKYELEYIYSLTLELFLSNLILRTYGQDFQLTAISQDFNVYGPLVLDVVFITWVVSLKHRLSQ